MSLNGIKDVSHDTYNEKRWNNLILVLSEQARGAEALTSYPIAAMIDPASMCNLRCRFCFHNQNRHARRKTVIDRDVFEQVFSELGPYLFQTNLFNWGEPLLNADLAELLGIVKRYDIETRISSNFSLSIPDKTLEAMVTHQLDVLTVSVDGISQNNYERYRKGGRLSLALSNIERLSEIKRSFGSSKPRIDWQFLVFRFNEQERREARQVARKIGADLRFAAPFISGEADPMEWLSTDPRFVLDCYKESSESSVCEPKDATPPKQHPCDWLYLNTTINADGTVSPCCALPEQKWDLGDLNSSSFREIWNNNAFQAARQISVSGKSSINPGCPIACVKCPIPNQKNDYQTYAHRALARAPRQVRERARQSIPGLPEQSEFRSTLFRAEKHLEELSRFLPYSLREPLRRELRFQATQGPLARNLTPFLRKILY